LHYFASVAPEKPNALVVSGFVHPDDPDAVVVVGAFTSAVFQKLKQLAPEEQRRLTEFIGENRGYRPGDVRDFELRLEPSVRKLFPFDRVFVALLSHGTGIQNMEQELFEGVMTRVFERAQQSGVLNIVVPVVGYNQADQHAVELRHFFRSFFAAIRPSSDPATVWIDIYSEWPTVILESIVASLNTALSQTSADVVTNRFYRQHVRGFYLMLMLCLLSTSYVIRLTWKSVAMITLLFTPVYFGLDAALAPFLGDLSSRSQLIIAAGVYVTLALLFPLVVRLNPRDLFKRGRGTS